MQLITQSKYIMILQLIQDSLYGSHAPTDEVLNVDWQDIYTELEQQTITCLVADVLEEHRYAIPTELQSTWVNRLAYNISSYHRILAYQDATIQALNAKNVPVVVLKGAISAMNYPRPERRIMGDIDLFVPVEHFEEARDCLLQEGFTYAEGESGNIDDASKQKHLGMQKDGIILELHIRAFRLSDRYADILLNQTMEAGLQDIQWMMLEGYHIPALPMLQNAIELLVHVQGHFCNVGIGLRQIVDWMLFAQNNLTDEVYDKEFKPILMQTGLETFAQTLTRMCQLYLGLPEDNMHWCMDAEEATCEQMLEYVFQQGNFGHKNTHDSGARALARLRNPIEFLKSIQSVGLSYHPEWKSRKVLRHFAWVPQLGRYIRYTFAKDTDLKADYKEGKKRSELFENLKLFQTRDADADTAVQVVSERHETGLTLVTFICDVIHNRAFEDGAISLSEFEMQNMIEYASNQGLLMYLNEHPAFRDFMTRENSRKKVLSSMYLYTLQTEEVKQLLDMFEKNQIDCMVLKGVRSRELYPKAEWRSMGDIDLLYKSEDTKRVQQVMANLGYRGEGDTAIHDHYAKKMLTVEMHKTLCAPERRESAYFETVWDRAKQRDGYSHAYEMMLEDHYLFTFTHLVEHFRNGGIGIRMVLDMYILSQLEAIDWKYVDDVLKELKYDVFHLWIRELAETWFGENGNGKMIPDLQELESYILHGGIFGSTENDRMNVQLQYRGKTDFLKQVVFPSYQTMQTVYPWLKSRLFLPIAWVMRFFQAIFHRRGNVKTQLSRAQAFGNDKKELGQRRQFFEKMGLS